MYLHNGLHNYGRGLFLSQSVFRTYVFTHDSPGLGTLSDGEQLRVRFQCIAGQDSTIYARFSGGGGTGTPGRNGMFDKLFSFGMTYNNTLRDLESDTRMLRQFIDEEITAQAVGSDNMVDLIIKKRAGEVLTNEEIKFFIDGYVNDSIPDYQISALLMAICFQGMNEDETAFLTKCMIESGDTIDLNKINGIKVDKHSTGGVGDKTSLVLGPIVAACGGKVAKMSGRGLGHTGGTLDKLESIPNMKIGLTIDEFINQVNKIGLSIIGQTQDLVPADKKLYALRDVTGTVESIPLIASSIMSKKLATGADAILLDVKWGSGAFFKTVDGAKELAKTMVKLGNNLNKSTKAMITDMDNPLGKAIGNILEVKEAIETLKGNGPDDLVELCVNAAAIMLTQSNIASTIEEGKAMALNSIKDGSAFNKFRLMVEAQAGDVSYIDDLNRFPVAKNIIPVTSEQEGYISHIDALTLGVEAMHLGAGRKTKDDVIDYTAGITLEVKPLDKVNKGDVLAYLHTNIDDYQDIINKVRKAFTFSKRQVEKSPIIHEIIE